MKSKIQLYNIIESQNLQLHTAIENNKQETKVDLEFLKNNLLSEIIKRNPVEPNELEFYWDDAWKNYLEFHDIKQITADLKSDMDKYSVEYIDIFLKLIDMLPHKQNIFLKEGYGWTQKDAEYIANTQQFSTKYPLTQSEKFMFANKYGLNDIYDEIKEQINGKDIIDGGAFNGNTALLFHEIFSESNIYSFEPMENTYDLLEQTIINNTVTTQIFPIKKALGTYEEFLTIHFCSEIGAGSTLLANDSMTKKDTVEVTTVDIVAKENDLNIALIKLDIEGFEKKALEGAKEVLKKNKPVVVAAMYHNPVDFFEIKKLLIDLNPSYKFMIRRSEQVIPLGDIVLVAY